MTSDWRGARCAWPPCDVEEGCGQSTQQSAPHIQGLRSPPEKKIASAAVITTRSNRALSRLKSTTDTKNSASTRIRVTLVILVINSSLRSKHDSESQYLPCVQSESRLHFDLLQSANSRGNHVPLRAAQEHRTIQIGVAFKNRHDIDKALERFELKHRGSFYLLHGQRCATTGEPRRGMFLHWPRIDCPHCTLDDCPPSP